jgi:hypothetical protein
MWLPFVAFLAAVQPAVPTTVSPVEVTAPLKDIPTDAKVEVAGDEQGADRYAVSIWPATAYQTLTQGQVILACLIDVHGLAEWCRVEHEHPAGKGFGKAALQLRPTFKIDPKTAADGKPVNAVMTIGLTFNPPKKELYGTQADRGAISSIRGERAAAEMARIFKPKAGNPLAMRKVTMVDNPVWIAAPDFDDLARAYPAGGGGIEGYAAVHCKVDRRGPDAGALSHCQIIKETPHDRGFAQAALGLARQFRLEPAALSRAPRSGELWVDIPIRLPPSQAAELRARTVNAPVWVSGIDPATAPKLFPPQAADQGITSGRGVARCTVEADGALSGCTPLAGAPDGVGFSEAAAKLSETLRMNLWSADAAPVIGGTVEVPIRLNLRASR